MNKNTIDLDDKYKVNADGCVIIARYDDDITFGQLIDGIIPKYKREHPCACVVFDADMREVQDRNPDGHIMTSGGAVEAREHETGMNTQDVTE